MASTHKHIRSGTANKRPTTAIADGQIALNTNLSSPGLFFKDSTGAEILKIGPVHVGATAPNASPAGSAGNSTGEIWLDTSLTPVGVKIWNGSAFVNATPIGSTTVQGLLELATDAETQAGADTARAVTSASLQSKLSDSTSTTSNTTIASSTAVKAAYDLANAALPKTGGTVTGNLEIGTAGSLSFEGATADGFETTIAITDPTADRTITLPNTTGTIVTTGDTGTVTSTMILDGTIVDADINASAEIAVSKLADGSARQLLQTDAAGTGVEWASNIDIPGTLDVTSAATFDSTVAVTGALTKSGSNVVTVGDTGTVTSTMILDGTILNADVNASAAIAGTKISPDFGAQTIVTTGVHSAALGAAATPSITFTGDLNTGIFSPGADQVAVATSGVQRVKFGTTEVVFNDGGENYDFRVEGDTNANLFFVDASADAVGIGSTSDAGFSKVSIAGDAVAGLSNIVTLRTASTNSYGLQIKGNYTTEEWLINNYYSAALAFGTANTERARIDSSGRLLIGTSNSRQVTIGESAGWDPRVQVTKTGTDGGNIAAYSWSTYNTSTGGGQGIGPDIVLARSNSDTEGTHTALTSAQLLGRITFNGSNGTSFASGAYIAATADDAWASGDHPTRLVFSTTTDGASSPTERIIINSAGTLYPATDNAFQAGSAGYRWTAIYAVNGTIQTSDARQKTDVSSCSLGSAFIKSLQPVSYKWIEGGNTVTKSEDGETDVVTPVPGERTHWGFLAQDVKAAVDDAGVDFGGWILTDKDDPDSAQGLRYDQFIAPLTKALQETMAELEALKAEVAALKAQ